MTLANTQRVPGTGEVHVAPVGTAGPANVATALAAAFKGLGYTTDDGVTVSRGLDRTPVTAWQSIQPLKFIYNAGSLTVAAAFQQSEARVAALWWGSDFAANTTEWKADMSTVPTAQEKAVVFEWVTDDGKKHRIYIPRAEVSETGDVQVSRSVLAFAVTFAALAPPAGTTLATWFTDDPAFNPA